MNDGIALTNITHPEGDPIPDDLELNPDTLETIEIDIPMNERIKELAEQAGFDSKSQTVWAFDNFDLECFAELIRQDERELCAKLCDERERSNLYGVNECAAAIRERGDK
jgi:hypothetical protein